MNPAAETPHQKVERMLRPEALRKDEPLLWSPGTGIQVWETLLSALTGDCASLLRLLEAEPALARCQYIYRTPLYFAVRENQLEAARLLLERGADATGSGVNDSFLEMAAERGYTAMRALLDDHLENRFGAAQRGEAVAAAIRACDIKEVRRLLDADPALLGAGDLNANQPIHWAVMTRQIELIDELLDRGADIEATRADGARPLHLTNGDYNYRGWRDVPATATATANEVLQHLLRRGAYLDICTAAHIGDEERVRTLLDGDPALANYVSGYSSYYPGSGSALKNAAGGGHFAIVKLLLDRGADANLPEEHIAPQGHALYEAVANGHYEIARLLLEHGAFPNPPVESSADALTRAIDAGDERMVELLCSYGASRSLSLLSYSGDIKTAAALFSANPVLAEDPKALAIAAGNGHEAFCRLMLRYQPDLASRIVFDEYWNVGARTPELNELLFAHGLNAAQPDWLGVTPLHCFARKGDTISAAQFLEHGADINARDDDICSTPLAWAARYGQVEMVQFLLDRGARPLPEDQPWAAPLASASRRGHGDVVRLLLQASI